MNLGRCEKGHFYDQEKFESCPHCKMEAENTTGMMETVFEPKEVVQQNFFNAKEDNLKIYNYYDKYILKQKEDAKELSTLIYEVELFRNSSQIRRRGTFKSDGKGSTAVVILDLPYSLRENSIHIMTETGLGLGSVNIFSYYKEGMAESDILAEQSIELFENMRKLSADIKTCDIKIDGLDKYINKQIRQNGIYDENTEKLANYEKERKILVQQKIDLEKKLKSIKKQKKKIKDKRENLQYEQKKYYGIRADFITESAGEYVFSLDYVVNNAGWKPGYDIYAYTDRTELTVVLKAEVFQNSDEDWDNVRLKLTTESDLIGFNMDQLSPENISIEKKEQIGNIGTSINSMPNIFCDDEIEYGDDENYVTTEFMLADSGDKVALPKTPEVVQLNNSIQRKYILPENVSIINGTSDHTVTISDKTWQVNKIFFAIPKNDLSEYMGVMADELKDEEWLGGYAKIYIDGTYSTTIDTNRLSGNDILTLGRVSGVDLRREVITNKIITEKISGQKEIYRVYQICAENKTEKTVRILIMDQIPISRNPLISVTNVNTGDASVDEQGICRWDVSIEPNEQVVLNVEYAVVYHGNAEIKW